MKTIEQWLDEYGESHRNPTNKALHWVCVPLILFSILGLLWAIPSGPLQALVPAALEPAATWATLFVLAAGLFYLRLSVPMFLGMGVVAFAALFICHLVHSSSISLPWLSVAIFVLAWVGQFIGHHIEGKKPSFFQDIQFLLIGPAWLLGFIYRRLGIRY